MICPSPTDTGSKQCQIPEHHDSFNSFNATQSDWPEYLRNDVVDLAIKNLTTGLACQFSSPHFNHK